jgi:hypothetical protein
MLHASKGKKKLPATPQLAVYCFLGQYWKPLQFETKKQTNKQTSKQNVHVPIN